MIWGVDLGVRSYYAVGLPEHPDQPVLFMKCELKRGKTRYEEVRHIVSLFGEHVTADDIVVVEEPPLAGPMNKRTFGQLSMTAGAILSATSAQGYLVPVSTWKKDVVGSGSATKEVVNLWLYHEHPDIHAQCGGDQNLMDAACIALYGHKLTSHAGYLGAAEPGSVADHL